jgi:hypothetical protein
MPSASTKLAAFFNILRDTGTELPVSNAELANFLMVAVDNLSVDYCSQFANLKKSKLADLKLVQENLSADLEVMIESLNFMEEDTDPDEEEEENEDED